MDALWATFLELFQIALFWLTQFYGGHLASAILTFSLLARLALLPLGVRLALRARAHAGALKRLSPALADVRERWKDAPERLASETLAVYRRHGVSPLGGGALRGSLLQAPVFFGMYHAVRDALAVRGGAQGFLWVANLSKPDLGVALAATALTGLAGVAGASGSQPTWAVWIPAVLTGGLALVMSSGFGLYLAAGGLTSTLQGLVVRRLESRGGSNAS